MFVGEQVPMRARYFGDGNYRFHDDLRAEFLTIRTKNGKCLTEDDLQVLEKALSAESWIEVGPFQRPDERTEERAALASLRQLKEVVPYLAAKYESARVAVTVLGTAFDTLVAELEAVVRRADGEMAIHGMREKQRKAALRRERLGDTEKARIRVAAEGGFFVWWDSRFAFLTTGAAEAAFSLVSRAILGAANGTPETQRQRLRAAKDRVREYRLERRAQMGGDPDRFANLRLPERIFGPGGQKPSAHR